MQKGKNMTLDQIITLEWEQFLDDNAAQGAEVMPQEKESFSRMRAAHLSLWDEPLQSCYLEDLQTAKEQGRNLLSEKKVYRYRYTDPERFSALSRLVPPVSEEKDALIEEIVRIEIAWATEFAARCPYTVGRGFPVNPQDERYQQAEKIFYKTELSIFSEKTLQDYLRLVQERRDEGVNMVREVQNQLSLASVQKTIEESEAELAWQLS